MLSQDQVEALEQFLGIKLPADFEVKLTLSSPELQAPVHGTATRTQAKLDDIQRVRFRSVACW